MINPLIFIFFLSRLGVIDYLKSIRVRDYIQDQAGRTASSLLHRNRFAKQKSMFTQSPDDADGIFD